jgi:lysozyme family protein
MMTPEKFVETTLMDHEGLLSLDPSDSGNWFDRARYRTGLPQKRGFGELVGSKYGITAYALANYLNVDCITKTTMEQLEKPVAVAIALHTYFEKPKLDTLQPQNRVTLALLDMAFNAGAGEAIELLQAATGAAIDGKLGPQTRRIYEDYIHRYGEDQAMVAFTLKRKDYYRSIARGSNAKYLKGWLRRADSFLPGTVWWNEAGR